MLRYIVLFVVVKTINCIQGGKLAPDGDFPYAVGVCWQGLPFCGGILITPSHVLSTIHCAALLDVLTVKGGSNHVNDSFVQERNISKSIRHPNYNPDSMENDLIIYVLDKPFELNDNFTLANYGCSSSTPLKLEHSTYITIGWGFTDTEFNTRDLHMIEVEIMERQLCRAAYAPFAPDYTISETNICIPTEYRVGPCEKDLGGPLIERNSGQDVVLGLNSWMFSGCAVGMPDVFTEVADYCDFIGNNIE